MILGSIPAFHRNGRRFVEVASTLLKYGLADRLDRVEPRLVRRALRHQDLDEIAELPLGVRLRRAFEELGPTFIKIGQVLSTRGDVVTEEVARELEGLRSNAPADPFDVVREVVEEELGRPISELFESFEETPLASASIGQVHVARLPGGREVVVKVQHPGIERAIGTDFDVLRAIAALVHEHDEDARPLQLVTLVDEARRTLEGELDFGRELRNLERFREHFEEDGEVVVPAAHRRWSSRRVLTMEKVEGLSVAKTEELAAQGHDLSRVASAGARAFLDMVFEVGVFHADPHPGNVLVQPDGRIALIDFGMVGYLDEELREGLVDLLVSFVDGDEGRLDQAIGALAELRADSDRDRLRRECAELQADLAGASMRDLEAGPLMTRFTAILRRGRVHLRPQAAQLVKVLVILEGTARGLDREVSLVGLLRPYCERAIEERMAPRTQLRRAARVARAWSRLGARLPAQLEALTRRIEAGELRIDLVHAGLESSVRRLVQGVLCAALMIAGALLWGLGAAPLVAGVSVPGLLAVGLALLHGLTILRASR